MKRSRICLRLACLLGAAVPAYANNPPGPDGVLSLVMIFPVAILGLRWAGAKLPRKWTIVRGMGLALVTLLTFFPEGIGAISLLILLVYGLRRGAQVMQHGQGVKRFAIGAFVMLFTLFALANNGASRNVHPPEAVGSMLVHTIRNTEETFQSTAILDANKNGVGEYGTLEQLVRADLLGESFLRPRIYQFVVVLSGEAARDEKQYFLYARPTDYGEAPWWTLSLLRGWQRTYALRTFACDETGIIRAMDLGTSRAVTREEAQKWPPL